MNRFSIGVIISTYNNPEWLRKTLWGYSLQTHLVDQVIIADDGSREDTRQMVENEFYNLLNISYVWHEDKGFRKTMILNKALLEAKTDYLIFTDQDCIPREDFVQVHYDRARKGRFLSGGYFKLPLDISQSITYDDIKSGNAFSLSYLREHGLKRSFKSTKLFRNKYWSLIMNSITPTKASWNGMNSSGWREDLLNAGGFDERMAYGGEDRELGERLNNNGIRGIQIRYSAVTMHLDHGRPYVNTQAWEINNAIRKETKKKKITKTQFGIK